MSHQPFESWILSDEPLDKEQTVNLQNHLLDCEPCRELQSNWQKVRSTITASIMPEPVPGFSSRWQVRLAVSQQKQQQRRWWIITLGIFALATLILVSLMLFNLFNATWPYLFSQLIANIGVAIGKVGHFWKILGSLTRSFPITIPVMVIFGTVIISAAAILILTWFSSMVRLFTPGSQGVTER